MEWLQGPQTPVLWQQWAHAGQHTGAGLLLLRWLLPHTGI